VRQRRPVPLFELACARFNHDRCECRR
jgi:hypothetical protein